MSDHGGRNRPEAWGSHVVSITTQVVMVLLGLALIVIGGLSLDGSPLTGVVMLVVGVAFIVMARPWLLVPRSYAALDAGGLDGGLGRTLERRPPSLLAGLALVALGLAVIAGGVAYAVMNWGQEGSGAGVALFLCGLGGAGLVALGGSFLLPTRRSGLDLLVTAEGIEHKHEGERILLAWHDIGEITPISRGGVALQLPQAGVVAQRLGFNPNQNLIQIRDPQGRRAAEWRCRSFVADPVEVLELLQRRQSEESARR